MSAARCSRSDGTTRCLRQAPGPSRAQPAQATTDMVRARATARAQGKAGADRRRRPAAVSRRKKHPARNIDVRRFQHQTLNCVVTDCIELQSVCATMVPTMMRWRTVRNQTRTDLAVSGFSNFKQLQRAASLKPPPPSPRSIRLHVSQDSLQHGRTKGRATLAVPAYAFVRQIRIVLERHLERQR